MITKILWASIMQNLQLEEIKVAVQYHVRES